ncbi:MAG: hypothetical protein WBA57_07025 [Elainellaceae cyanobacterium]
MSESHLLNKGAGQKEAGQSRSSGRSSSQLPVHPAFGRSPTSLTPVVILPLMIRFMLLRLND